MSVNKSNQTDCVVDLTFENMVQHEARYRTHAVMYRASIVENQAIYADGLFMMGGATPSSAARAKTCGLALAMVAIFCYFPGISMVISIGRVGITNKTKIGIIFTSAAVTLTLISTVLCLRTRYRARQVRKPVEPVKREAPACKYLPSENQKTTEVTKTLLSSRDECCVGSDNANRYSMPSNVLCECDEVELANRIAQSFSLSRYFAKLDAANGPFDLDKEAMDRVTEFCIRGSPRSLYEHRFAKRPLQKENSSSIDSAIDVGYDDNSMKGVTVV